MRIDGKKIAASLTEMLRARSAPERAIVAILVGHDPSSKSFLRQKGIVAAALGIAFSVRELPPESTTQEVILVIDELKADKGVGGIIVQLPLPQQVSRSAVLAAIPPEKDIDCLTPSNLGEFERGSALMPPAAGAIEAITQTLDLPLGRMRAAVVGRGLLVGMPAATYLKRHARLVEVLGRADDLKKRILEADLIVSGTGEKNLISAEYVREGAVVIDFGYPHDADFEAIDKKGGIVTPTPGGTGPIVVAKLFENFYRLNGRF
ncbi:MAG: bifunctional 5,10-methylenetetrahydrofolate dehydrogenase/5,10-methenyltetrahydrofolate cyclohydrolase [bacterium]|nr:bifunctional 5,10-methylenetetrahydrofolate dehydrogenase/5,10-methenyltetrahydrofolate cyclohydrolase [bacterium]